MLVRNLIIKFSTHSYSLFSWELWVTTASSLRTKRKNIVPNAKCTFLINSWQHTSTQTSVGSYEKRKQFNLSLHYRGTSVLEAIKRFVLDLPQTRMPTHWRAMGGEMRVFVAKSVRRFRKIFNLGRHSKVLQFYFIYIIAPSVHLRQTEAALRLNIC